jgi:phosphatidate cytidylyltransferase
MAINIQTLRTRALTALVFVLVMLFGLLWNQWTFIILFAIIHFGCWYEFVKLVKKITGEKYFLYSLLGLIYITMPLGMMIDIFLYFERKGPINDGNIFSISKAKGFLVPSGIIYAIWLNDTMAYLVGSVIGKTAFSKISPKKTWEGTIGGVIMCVVVMGIWGYFAPVAQRIQLQHWVIISAICALFSIMGDLFESKLKRIANVKDSGAIMPGHGGFLDRFDSLLVATPFVWMYVVLFM